MMTVQEKLIKSLEYLTNAVGEGKYGEDDDIDWTAFNEDLDQSVEEAGSSTDEDSEGDVERKRSNSEFDEEGEEE